MASSSDIYVGTGLKFKLEIVADGFSMEDDYFEVVVSNKQKSIHIGKESMLEDGEGNFYFVVDSNNLGSGNYRAVVTAYVPDTDFESGIRNEVQVFDLITVRRI